MRPFCAVPHANMKKNQETRWLPGLFGESSRRRLLVESFRWLRRRAEQRMRLALGESLYAPVYIGNAIA
jgi:hypothetical protein